jgi:chitin disaccharide deacetylase
MEIRRQEQRMDATRFLTIIADDFGIGPETSRGILELAAHDLVSGAVLLVNSPYADEAARAWRRTASDLEMGWHPCLTLDRPCAAPGRVPSLLGPDGRLLPMQHFLTRLYLHQICPRQIEIELNAQYNRFLELVGHAPTIVNSHQHVSLFAPVGAILRGVLKARRAPLPYLRRVQEPWSMLARITGARTKRTLLTLLGRMESRHQVYDGFPGNDALAGITNPAYVSDPGFFARWLALVPGRLVELACHPGHLDRTLLGRDCTEHDGLMQRRVDEMRLLQQENFLEACRIAGFRRVSPSEMLAQRTERLAHAA